MNEAVVTIILLVVICSFKKIPSLLSSLHVVQFTKKMIESDPVNILVQRALIDHFIIVNSRNWDTMLTADRAGI